VKKKIQTSHAKDILEKQNFIAEIEGRKQMASGKIKLLK